jgi:hypothetical protein
MNLSRTSNLGLTLLAAGLLAAPLTATAAPTAPLDRFSNQVVLAWSEEAYQRFAADGYQHPMEAARVLAMMHLAQHDALQAIDPAFASYALTGVREPAADAVTAAATAAHDVLLAVLPHQRQALAEALDRSLAAIPAGNARERGRELGSRAAAAILALRAGDGADTPVRGDYQPRSGAGAYQYVAPWDLAFAPGWRDLRPFALERPEQFRNGPPPALTSARYTQDFVEIRAVGGKQSRTRTAEQTAYGKFWYEFSDIGWNRIARVVTADRGLGLQSAARLFALLNMALSDAYVAGWDAKFHYDFWRPTTAIRGASDDGNAATLADASWESAEVTPPVQDYPSTHSALGDAGAEVLEAVFGDRTSFAFTSTTADPPGSERRFTSFRQAADENADSRVVAGLHFRFSCEAGQELGRKVGRYTVRHHLKPR